MDHQEELRLEKRRRLLEKISRGEQPNAEEEKSLDALLLSPYEITEEEQDMGPESELS